MRKTLFVAFILAVSCMRSSAQNMSSSYQTSVGVKFWPGAITFKHFIADNTALEGLANFWEHGFRFTALYEIHGDIDGAPGLKWYVGPGAHIGGYNDNWKRGNHVYEDGGFSLGADGVLGLDYKINGAPINLALDINPFLELATHTYVGLWGGLSIRYTF